MFDFDLIIIDLCLFGVFGIDIIFYVEGIFVLVMISYVSFKFVVEFMKMGVVDYIVKFFDYDEMFMFVECILKEKVL